jgi:hypothetical protein
MAAKHDDTECLNGLSDYDTRVANSSASLFLLATQNVILQLLTNLPEVRSRLPRSTHRMYNPFV